MGLSQSCTSCTNEGSSTTFNEKTIVLKFKRFEDKMRAIGAHASQLPAPEIVEDKVREWLSAAAAEAGGE